MEPKKENPLFYKDLLALQNELRSVVADSTNPHYRSTYASLTAVIEYARPILTKHNFFITQLVDTTDLGTHLIHVTGEKLVSNYPLPPNQDLATVQKFGAALSYARRYSLMAMLGLGVEDDDGNQAAHAPRVEPRPAQAQVNPSTIAIPVYEEPTRAGRFVKPSTVTEPPKVGTYLVSFGKYNGKHLYEIPTHDIESYCEYLARSEKQSPQGLEFVKFGREEVARRNKADEEGSRLPF